MTAMTTKTQIPWIDLSDYGMKLSLAQDKVTRVPIYVLEGDEADLATARALGFTEHPQLRHILILRGSIQNGRPMRPNVSLPDWKRHFPNCRVMRTTEQDVYFVNNGPRERVSVKIGINRLGQEVFENAGVRFLKDRRDSRVREDEANGIPAGLFLRARDEEALSMCAEGLVEEIVAGRIISEEEFVSFMGKIGWPEARRLDAERALALASARWLSRKSSEGTSHDSYNAAVRIHDALGHVKSTLADSRPPIALPISVVMHRILGTHSDLQGKTLFVDSVSSGDRFAFAPRDMSVVTTGDNLASDAADFVQSKLSRAPIADVSTRKAFQYSLTSPARRLDDLSRRGDLIEARSTLLARDADGVSVFLFRGSKDESEEKELARFQIDTACDHVVLGSADVDAVLCGGTPQDDPFRMIVVGPRRDEILAAPPAEMVSCVDVRDYASFWTWSSEVIRRRIGATASIAPDEDGRLVTQEENRFQVPYTPASRIGSPTTLVPKNLDGATRDALKAVARLHSDVDAWVAGEFGYTVEELAEIFAPEQIDAMALYLHAEERDRGFLNADQTGIGKGRFLAAVMRRAALRGYKTIFSTENAANLSDIWRDIVDTRSDTILQPVILNDDTSIYDPRSQEILLRSPEKAATEQMLASRRFPEGANLVLTTYSQFNREPKDSTKSAWLRDIDKEDVVAVLDEAHNAAGASSNTGVNIRELVKGARNVTYSSATYSKDAQSMGLYHRLFPADLSVREIEDIMARGGEPMQEIVANILVQDGVMIRRETDLSAIDFDFKLDEARRVRNRDYMDRLSPILAEMADVSATVTGMLQAGLRRGEAAEQPGQVEPLTKMAMGSPIDNLCRLFVSSLLCEQTIEEALTALRSGEAKPVILVDNTLQSFLEEISAAEDDDIYTDFRGLVHRTLSSISHVYRTDQFGARTVLDLTERDPRLKAKIRSIRAQIDALPELPASTIDAVKEAIERAGFTADELTGRSLELRNGKVQRRRIRDRVIIKNEFNNGKIDALIINQAGCTGIDLHSSTEFQDQRQRHMVVNQEPLNILKLVQAFGRVNRRNQVSQPKVTTLTAGLPVETRRLAMRNQKLRRLSANITSNRDTASLARSIPDLINAIGDRVCAEYAEARPNLMRRLGYTVNDHRERKAENEGLNQGENSIDNRRSANDFLTRLSILSIDEQERIISEITAEYQSTLEEMEAKGYAPMSSKEVPGTVVIQNTNVFDGGDAELSSTIFDAPLFNADVAIRREGKPMRAEDLERKLELGLSSSAMTRSRLAADTIEKNITRILETYLPKRFGSVEAALADGDFFITTRQKEMTDLARTLRAMEPGSEIHFSGDLDMHSGIVTAIHHAPPGQEHVASLYTVEFAMPGDKDVRRIKMSSLLRDQGFKLEPGLAGADYDAILKRFDTAVHVRIRSANILMGNLFKAMKLSIRQNIGSLVSFRTEDGVRHRGILVPRSAFKSDLDRIPPEISKPSLAATLLTSGQGIEIRSDQNLGANSIWITDNRTETMTVSLPAAGRRWEALHRIDAIKSLARRGQRGADGGVKVLVRKDEVPAIMNTLYEAGYVFYAPVHMKDLVVKAASGEKIDIPAAGMRVA